MRKYRTLYRIDGRPLPRLPRSVQRDILRACRIIERRTNCTCWYSERHRCVQYHLGIRPTGGPAVDFLLEQGSYLPIDPESAIRRIRSARASRARKDEMLRQSESRIAAERARRIDNLAQDLSVKGSLCDELKFLANRIHNPHSRNTVLVN